MTIGASLKHKNTQLLYIFNRENPQNSEPQNGPRSGLDYIALHLPASQKWLFSMYVPCFATRVRFFTALLKKDLFRRLVTFKAM